jgi:bifunctional non-homologous end joining protein LigD
MAPTRTGSRRKDTLEEYRRKRDFARTPEPSGDGGRPEAGAPRFVVQRHRARRLHYDFRLEIDGVLASWAVPKGPTLDPKARRAAFHVEDHPIEYIDFEGIIPAGGYGGGDVIVWDAGTWRPAEGVDDPGRALAGGELHLDMFGEKLRGRFVLVRTGKDGDRERWLLLHKKDEFAKGGWDPEDHPRSVLSGRTNDEVKADPDRMWRSDQPAARAAVPLKATADPAGDDALRELDGLRASGGVWHVFGRDLKVTNLDKVLFPPRAGEEPVTKRDLLRYTARIAPTLLPYVRRRAFNMHRYPNGAQTKGFWHKALPHHAPDWLPRWDNPDADPGETRTYLVVDEPAALVWAANFGALEWHAWTSTVDRPDRPSWALIDLDPGEKTTWDDVLALARLHRTALEHVGAFSRPKVTGRRGIQIWVPIAQGPDFTATRAWVEKLSRTVGAVVPDLVSWSWEVKERKGKARLDYTQNAVNKTLVAPYSPRPAPGAPVSAPIDWDELDDPGLRPDAFTIRSIVDRLAEKGDLFRDLLDHPQKLPRLD